MLSYIYESCSMGGYGIYIWPCYGLFLFILSWQIFKSLKRNIKVYTKIKQELWSGTK